MCLTQNRGGGGLCNLAVQPLHLLEMGASSWRPSGFLKICTKRLYTGCYSFFRQIRACYPSVPDPFPWMAGDGGAVTTGTGEDKGRIMQSATRCKLIGIQGISRQRYLWDLLLMFRGYTLPRWVFELFFRLGWLVNGVWRSNGHKR